MSDGNDIVYWWDGAHWTLGTAPIPDAPGPPIFGGIWYCGPNTMHITDAGVEGQVLTSHGSDTPTWETPASVSVTPPEWFIPTFANGWVNYASTWDLAGYRKTADNMGKLKGLVKGGVVGVPIFTLPVGFRPPRSSIHTSIGGYGIARIDISPDGVVKVRSYQNGGTNAYVSLADIEFSLV